MPQPDPPRPSPFTFRKKNSAKLSWPIGAPRRLHFALVTIRHGPQPCRLCRQCGVIRPKELANFPHALTQRKNMPRSFLPASRHFKDTEKARKHCTPTTGHARSTKCESCRIKTCRLF